MFEYVVVSSNAEYEAASLLFKEYAQWLNINLSFQSFEQELVELKKMYAGPKGMILLCRANDRFMACVAVRPNEDGIAEIKRMYVKSEFQGRGVGQALLDHSIDFCKKVGYGKVRLDTLNTMKPAMNLYQKNGFIKIPPYYYNPFPEAVYFEKMLKLV
jgi:putative acetyltransferase